MTTEPRTVIVGEGWPNARPGGLNRYVADLHRALAAIGSPTEVLIVGPADDDPRNVTVHAVSNAGEQVGRRLSRLRAAARRLHPDVVDAHFALYAWPLVVGGPWRRVPLVVHFHGPWADESAAAGGSGPTNAVKRRIERAVYRRARRVVVLSHAFADLAVNRYGIDPTRVVVIPPGVDLDRFTPGDAPADRTGDRARFDLPADAFVAVAVRRLEERMGLDNLLDAWAEVQRASPDSVLMIAGAGSRRDALDAQRRGLPLPAGVRLLGAVDDADLPALYRAADCSVVPSRALEGFGLVVLESLACGTPVVVTDVGGLPEAVAGLDVSLVVPGDDPDALAARLVTAANGMLPDRVACRAHAERFTWPEVAHRHVALYRDVAAPRLRVAFVGHTAAASGGELALARLLEVLDVDAHVILGEDGPLVERLRRTGAQVEVLAMDAAVRNVRRDRVRFGRLPFAAAFGALRGSWRLARRLRRLRPDLVHTNTLKAHLYGGLAAQLAGVPVVWHVRDRLAADYLPATAVRLVRLAAVLPRRIIANSEATRATLPARAARRTTVVHDGVAATQLAGPSVMATRTHREGPIRIGIVGRIAPWKGQHVFLEAFARACGGDDPDNDTDNDPANDTANDAVAVVVGAPLFGEDDYAAGLVDLAARLGIADRVELRGHVDDVDAEYAKLDVLVHASVIAEPFGQVVLEGMAAGLPVIAADLGGPAELITDGVDGLLCPPADVEALAERISRLVADAELRARLGQAGRLHAAGCTIERTAAEVTAVYRDALSAGRRR